MTTPDLIAAWEAQGGRLVGLAGTELLDLMERELAEAPPTLMLSLGLGDLGTFVLSDSAEARQLLAALVTMAELDAPCHALGLVVTGTATNIETGEQYRVRQQVVMTATEERWKMLGPDGRLVLERAEGAIPDLMRRALGAA
jgi:hypothetical protein